MVEAIIGFAVGAAAGVALKDKIMGGNNEKDKLQSELNEVLAENEKFRNRNKDLERQVEDLLAEKKKTAGKIQRIRRFKRRFSGRTCHSKEQNQEPHFTK